MSVSPISGLVFLLLAAGAARAEDPSAGKQLTTYAIAMHGQPALAADFSRLPLTVRFDLSGLDSEMPLTLAMMPVLPKHGTDVERFDNPTLKPPVGTGPYVIADGQSCDAAREGTPSLRAPLA